MWNVSKQKIQAIRGAPISLPISKKMKEIKFRSPQKPNLPDGCASSAQPSSSCVYRQSLDFTTFHPKCGHLLSFWIRLTMFVSIFFYILKHLWRKTALMTTYFLTILWLFFHVVCPQKSRLWLQTTPWRLRCSCHKQSQYILKLCFYISWQPEPEADSGV